ncbi:MAG: PHB depolymerase family esterase [Bacteroidota bacterium]
MQRFLLFFLCLLGTVSLSAQSFVKTISHGGLSRTARIYVPATYAPGTPAPLVFNLHGFTSSASQQELYAQMNAVADTAGFIVAYGEGVNATWNAGLLPNSVDDVGFISAMIDSLQVDYTIDPARIYSCGMSMGGFMSYRLACELEGRIAAIASVTGLMAEDLAATCNPTRPVPVLQMHGTLDGVVPYNGSAGFHLSVDSTVNFWRNFNACQDPVVVTNLPDLVFEGSTGETYFYGGCQANTEVLLYRFENHAHAWPGALPLVPGITNQDVEGSVEIWNFFRRHPHPNPVLTSTRPSVLPQVEFYPQPASHQLQLRGIGEAVQIEISDVRGQFMGHWSLAANATQTVDVSTWAPGIYLAQIRGASAQTHRKFVVQ